jgi:hypothetical protein
VQKVLATEGAIVAIIVHNDADKKLVVDKIKAAHPHTPLQMVGAML